MTPNHLQVRLAGISGALAVALGAFGAHVLEAMLVANGRLDTWRTASYYHFFHTLALLVLAFADSRPGRAWPCLALGMGIFSGSLYLLAVTNIRWLGAITPIGGLLLILGWLLLALKRW